MHHSHTAIAQLISYSLSLRLDMPKSTQTSSSKPKAGKFVFYKAPHIPIEDVVKHRYSMFTTDTSGSVSKRSTMLKTVLPQSQSRLSDDIPQALSDEVTIESEINALDGEPLDTAYIDYLEEIGAEAKARRWRAQGVSFLLRIMTYWLTQVQDEPLRNFVPQTDLFLEEIISLDSRGPWTDSEGDICTFCQSPESGIYQCIECCGRSMCCKECILRVHGNLFLHRVQVSLDSICILPTWLTEGARNGMVDTLKRLL